MKALLKARSRTSGSDIIRLMSADRSPWLLRRSRSHTLYAACCCGLKPSPGGVRWRRNWEIGHAVSLGLTVTFCLNALISFRTCCSSERGSHFDFSLTEARSVSRSMTRERTVKFLPSIIRMDLPSTSWWMKLLGTSASS